MSRDPDLSIIIVSYNTRDLVLECLASLAICDSTLAQEVFVVDNGSRDDTVAAVRARHPQVHVIALPRNLGFAAGCNQALLKMRGRHALLLNSDTVVLPGALERCVDYLDAHPDTGAVGPQLLNEDRSRQNSIHNAPTLLQELLPPSLLRRLFPRRYPSKYQSYDAPVDVEAVLGAALFVRGEVVGRVGPLDEDYFFFLEETDWCCRMRDAGFRVVHVPDAAVVHVSGASSKRVAPLATRIEFHRSRETFYRKHRGPVARALLRAIVVTKTALGAVFGGRRAADYRGLLAWYLAGRPAGAGLGPA